MRIAFEVFGGNSWTGGINYLANLLSAVDELPGHPIEPILFASPQTDPLILQRLSPFLAQSPVLSSYWTKGSLAHRGRFLTTHLTACDTFALSLFRRERIDVAFIHASWLGSRFPIPTLVWIGDFQHRKFPKMFSWIGYAKREYGFRLLTKYATTIMASSATGCDECRTYFPNSSSRLESLPFVVRAPETAFSKSLAEVRAKYKLPERFFYLPNQFWRHKNHTNLFEAVYRLRKQGHFVYVTCSGNPLDPRDPGFYEKTCTWLADHQLTEQIQLLGMIPYEDVFALMRAALAMINPSFYEGWSTTVEEAKAIGIPMILSDIPVHVEQTVGQARFFNPHDPDDTARVLLSEWTNWTNESAEVRELLHINSARELPQRRRAFAEKFLEIAKRTVQRAHTGS